MHDREADRTPAQSRARAGASRLLRRGEAGREAATALLREAGHTAEKTAAIVAALLAAAPTGRRMG